jgi:uncharacterized protein (DUF362 family)
VSKIFLNRLGEDYGSSIAQGFRWLGDRTGLSRGARVAIKPNLTYPTYREGVMTSPAAVEALILELTKVTDRITIVESDSGGYSPFSMDEVFQVTGLAAMAARLGVKIVNLSTARSRPIKMRAGWRTIEVPLPTLLLDETDVFITMPVPKLHLNTVMSFAVKNQWGVIQQPSLRLKLHPWFADVIWGVNQALPHTLVVADGRWGLNRSGPMRGDPVRLDWLMVSDDILRADMCAAELMGLNWNQIPYLRHIMNREGVSSLAGTEFSSPVEEFRAPPFRLQREWTDLPGLACFRSRGLAWVGYESPLARLLHWLLYRFREPFY